MDSFKAIWIGLFISGTLIVISNFYVSFIGYWIQIKKVSKKDYKHTSGIPFIGQLLLLISLFKLPNEFLLPGSALILLDTSGVHIFFVTVGYHYIKDIIINKKK